MRKSVRRYSSTALKSAKKKVNSFNRAEGIAEQKMDQLRKEIEKLEAKKAPAYIIRLRTNDLLLLESKFKRVQFSRVNAEKKYQSYISKNDTLDAYRFVNAYIKFYNTKMNQGKRFTYRIIEKYSDKYLGYSSWSSRYKSLVFWAQVETQRVTKLKSKKDLSEKTIKILGTKLKDYIEEKENIVKIANNKFANKKEKKVLQKAKYKEKTETDMVKNDNEEDSLLGNYPNIDTNPNSEDSEDFYDQLEKNID